MTREEKINIITMMGIDIKRTCPYEYNLIGDCGKIVLKKDAFKICGDCFINALESVPTP